MVGGQWETEGLGLAEGAWTSGLEARGERGPVSATRTGGQLLCSWTPAGRGLPTEDHPLAPQRKPLLLLLSCPRPREPAEPVPRPCGSRRPSAYSPAPHRTVVCPLSRSEGRGPVCLAWGPRVVRGLQLSCCSGPSPLEQLRFHHPQREGRAGRGAGRTTGRGAQGSQEPTGPPARRGGRGLAGAAVPVTPRAAPRGGTSSVRLGSGASPAASASPPPPPQPGFSVPPFLHV